jgi:hypothetical protein
VSSSYSGPMICAPTGRPPVVLPIGATTAGPVLDHLAILDTPDVDLLGGVLLARWRLAEELAHVMAVHDHPSDNLVALADLVLDLGAHVSPEPAQPCHRLLETLRPLWASVRSFVVDEPEVNEFIDGLQPSVLEERPQAVALRSACSVLT